MPYLMIWEAGLALLLVFGRPTCAEPIWVPSSPVCSLGNIKDSILGIPNPACPLNGFESFYSPGVIEGDEVSLQRALNLVHNRSHAFVAVLFYASWCPFSGTFKPSFSILSSLFPSVPHYAVEESAVRPSILSKYGVHGFPTLFLLNSTMRVRYHGSRTVDSLTTFYSDVTGIRTESVDGTYLDRVGHSLYHQKDNSTDNESCPFSWARSPENLLQQETYLALATVFVLLRLLYIIFPALTRFARFAHRRYVVNLRLKGLWERMLAYLNRALLLFNSLKEPCKRSNLQEGAMNARAWASKSLASVSFGDASTNRVSQ